MGLFEVKEVDREFYDKRIRDFLPGNIIDFHTHVWLDKFRCEKGKASSRTVKWPSKVAKDNSIEDHLETYRLMFPDKKVTPLVFSNVRPGDDIDGANQYVKDCAKKHGLPSLIFSMPEWSGEELERRIIDGGFLGSKAYLTFAPQYIPTGEIRIFDFFPHHQLEVLNEHGWIAILHIPRNGRLKDPVNLAQIMEIERRYPRIKLVVAHVGRAYCPEDVGNAFEILDGTEKVMFDFCANSNQWVFEQLIKAVGPKRILFGSDMPILRMRTRRVCENGSYINLIPRGLYGDVSGDGHIREVDAEEAAGLTFFMYEEINAFRRAAESTGLSAGDIEDIFYNNARNLLNDFKK